MSQDSYALRRAGPDKSNKRSRVAEVKPEPSSMVKAEPEHEVTLQEAEMMDISATSSMLDTTLMDSPGKRAEMEASFRGDAPVAQLDVKLPKVKDEKSDLNKLVPNVTEDSDMFRGYATADSTSLSYGGRDDSLTGEFVEAIAEKLKEENDRLAQHFSGNKDIKSKVLKREGEGKLFWWSRYVLRELQFNLQVKPDL